MQNNLVWLHLLSNNLLSLQHNSLNYMLLFYFVALSY